MIEVKQIRSKKDKKKFFKFLTTVKESTFLFIEDIIAVNVIGIDTNKIFLITFPILSYL